MLAGNNPNWIPVSLGQATAHAANGGLALAGYRRPEKHSGHVATFSVGANISKDGIIANIGTRDYTGFESLNRSIHYNRPKVYFIFVPGYVGSVITVNQ
jgi:hypothetical protein